MADKDTAIVVIESIEDDEYGGKPFKRITDKDGQVYKIKQGREGKLKEKWPLLKEGLAVRLIFEEYTNPQGIKFPFVADFELVEDELPPPPIDVGLGQEPDIPLFEQGKPTGQTIGMCWKEIGELIRSRQLTGLIGKENTVSAMKAYRAYLLSILKIPFDGAKFPTFEEKKSENPPSQT